MMTMITMRPTKVMKTVKDKMKTLFGVHSECGECGLNEKGFPKDFIQQINEIDDSGGYRAHGDDAYDTYSTTMFLFIPRELSKTKTFKENT